METHSTHVPSTLTSTVHDRYFTEHVLSACYVRRRYSLQTATQVCSKYNQARRILNMRIRRANPPSMESAHCSPPSSAPSILASTSRFTRCVRRSACAIHGKRLARGTHEQACDAKVVACPIEYRRSQLDAQSSCGGWQRLWKLAEDLNGPHRGGLARPRAVGREDHAPSIGVGPPPWPGQWGTRRAR